MIEIDGRVTTNGGIRSTHATERAAQIYAARETLREFGWAIEFPSSTDGFRLGLLAPGEKWGPLDGSRDNERAQGFVATKDGHRVVVDASAGMPVVLTCETGVPDELRGVVDEFLGESSVAC